MRVMNSKAPRAGAAHMRHKSGRRRGQTRPMKRTRCLQLEQVWSAMEPLTRPMKRICACACYNSDILEERLGWDGRVRRCLRADVAIPQDCTQEIISWFSGKGFGHNSAPRRFQKEPPAYWWQCTGKKQGPTPATYSHIGSTLLFLQVSAALLRSWVGIERYVSETKRTWTGPEAFGFTIRRVLHALSCEMGPSDQIHKAWRLRVNRKRWMMSRRRTTVRTSREAIS